MAYDAVVVGSGPNGLSAAITLARAGLRVAVLEAHAQPGGGLSSFTSPLGTVHDTGSAIHPLAFASPAWSDWPLEAHGLRWVHPPAPYAHVWPDGRALALPGDLAEAQQRLGADGPAWARLFGPVLRRWAGVRGEVLRPLPRLPRDPLALAAFGLRALPPAPISAQIFRTPEARALWAGLAAHANVPLSTPGSGAAALLLGAAAHAGGWPFPAGGAGALAAALVSYFRSLGGELHLGTPVRGRADLPPARVTLLDTGLDTVSRLLRAPAPGYRGWLARFRYGHSVLKVDYALAGPPPWRDPAALQAATLHIGGDLRDIAQASWAVSRGRLPERPFVLAAQHGPFDPARGDTLWAYAQVPRGSGAAALPKIEAQLERAAPGFLGGVRWRRVTTAAELQAFSPVFGYGDVNGGRFDLPGLLARPVPTPTPYRTPDPDLYLCSAASPPGGGVHGMCGHHAARAALRDRFGLE